ncbi:3D domain-containing protein [Zhaonella formicivorans]|uniref:3D domain-containing protein n=1 Tax=Zhaonella formicivorans TaxID=2528593 RepID=UPI0010D92431|nr:3D domain-containing protein [Zhaonella formicivorans]
MFAVVRLRPRWSKRTWLAVAGLASAIFMAVIGYAWAVKTVTIADSGKLQQVKTYARYVEDVLQEQGIDLGREDVVFPAVSSKISEGMLIRIARAVNVEISFDGVVKTVRLADPTVERALELAGIELGRLDKVVHNLNNAATPNKKIRVIRVEEKRIEQNSSLSYPVKRQPDQFLAKGKSKVIQQGSQGVVKEVFAIIYTDGVETGRKVVERQILKEPVPEIIAYGTKDQQLKHASRELAGRRMLLMEASAYTHTGNRTATGIVPHEGVIAVDPKVIPLGTKLYVEGYGYGSAQDTGSAIKGNKIDLFYETETEALQWGRRSVQVYILE